MFPVGDLARMKAAQETHMPDTCHRLVWSSSTNDYKEIISIWTEDTTDIPCGLEQKTGKSEAIQADMTVVTYDAIVRLASSQATLWNVKDKLLVTKRFGSAITPIKYGIVSPVILGPSATRLELQRVDT